MDRIIIIDVPGGGLRKWAGELRRSGLTVEEYSAELPATGSVAATGLLGVVVHARRAEAIADLRGNAGLAGVPVLVWYPEATPEGEIEGWTRTGAFDFLVGLMSAKELKVRLKRLGRSLRSRLPWLQDAVQGLIRVTRSLTSREDDFTVLTTTARELERLFPGVQCVIMMVEHRGAGAMVLTQGFSAKPLDINLNLKKYPEIRKVLTTRKPVAIKNVQRHPLMREVRDLLRSKDLHSILAVPILYRNEVIGLIMLKSVGQPRGFERIEISFCEMMAQSTAVALRNLRLSREVAEEVQRKKEAERLVQQKSSDLARMEVFFDHAADGIVVADPRGRIRGVNVNFTRVSGYTKDDVEGRSVEEIIFSAPGESLSILRALKDRTQAIRRTNQVLHCKDGSRRNVAVRIETVPQRREWLISLHDLTEERELAEALRRTKEFLENVIQSSMDAIIAADMRGNIILFNRAAEVISGYRAEDVIGKMNIVDFYAPGVARDIMRKLRSDDYGGRGRLEACYNSMISLQGEELPINMSAAIIYEEGREVASVGIFQDLRERIRIEKELRSAQEGLMASQQREALSALSGAAAHELNQPLTSILGYGELLRRVERNLAEELPDHPAVASLKNALEIIVQEADRMATVVRKLGEVTEYKTRDYVGGKKILDLDQARGEPPADDSLLVFQSLFQHMKESVIVGGLDTMVRSANPAAVAVLGENPVGKSFTRYLKGINYTLAMEQFEKVKASGVFETEMEITNALGEQKFLRALGVPLPESKAFLGISRDVTDEKNDEQRFRDLSSFQDIFLKSATLPIIAYDVDGKISFWNQAAEKLFGWPFAEIRGQVPDFLIHKFDHSLYRDHLREIRAKGDVSGEVKVKRRDGEKTRIYFVNSVMRDEPGAVTGYLSMVFDLSKQQELEREVRDKAEQLTVMSDIAENIRTGVGLEEVLGGALKKIVRVVPLDMCAVTIAGGEPQDIMSLSYTPAEDKLNKVPLRLYEDAEMIRKVLFSKQPAVFGDISQLEHNFSSGVIGRELSALLAKGLRSVITYPLIFRGEVLGTLHVLSAQPNLYGEAELGRLAQLSGPIAMALANARLFNQIERQNLELAGRTAWMEALIRAGREISMETSPDKAVARLVEPYLQAHSWQHLTVWSLDPNAGLSLVMAHNYPEISAGQKLTLPPAALSSLQEKHETLQLDLVPGESEYQPLLAEARTALLAPLVATDKWLGLVLLESHHPQAFNEDEKVEIQVLATHVAAALRNLALFHELDLALRFQRGLFENAAALILILDPEGKVVLVNRALQEILDVPPESLIGTGFLKVFERFVRVDLENEGPISARDKKFRKLARRVESGEGLTNVRVTMVSPEGRESRAVFNTSTVLDRQGRFQGFIAIGQNITHYLDLERHLLQAEKLATLGQMAAGIAHELNNPITGVINAATLLKRREELSEKSLALVEQLAEEGNRIQNLAQNLMNYARPSREQMTALDLGRLLNESLSFAHYEISKGGVEVELRLPPDLPPVRGIKDQLQQVFINLLVNAAHACADQRGSKVVIEAGAGGPGAVEVKVVDTGPGIAPENLGRVFDPFFTTKPEGKGNGLGLTIVRDILERHAGRIRVESRPGQGATFIVTLPLYQNG